MVVIAVLVLQGLAVIVYCRVEERRQAPPALPPYDRMAGREAPDIALQDGSGRTSMLSKHRGRVVLLHFWASWCRPCRAELPRLLAASRRSAGHGPLLLAATIDDDWSAVAAFFGGAIPPEVVKVKSEDKDRYPVDLLPTTFVVAPDGSVRARLPGAQTWSEHMIEGLASQAETR